MRLLVMIVQRELATVRRLREPGRDGPRTGSREGKRCYARRAVPQVEERERDLVLWAVVEDDRAPRLDRSRVSRAEAAREDGVSAGASRGPGFRRASSEWTGPRRS